MTAQSTAPAGLARAWQRWLAENLLAGVPDATLLAELAGHGVTAEVAGAAIARLRRQPAYEVAQGLARRLDRLERQVAGRAALAALDPGRATVPRRAGLTREAFLAEHYAANRPVVVTDLVPGWPAFGLWTPAYFRDAYGDVPIEACLGRDADPAYDERADAHARPTTLGALATRVLETEASNDFYLIARNRAIAAGGLRPLLQDVGPLPAWLAPTPEPGWTSLWFGPAGTLTPMHHDASNICFCQLYGRKRFHLVAPDHPGLLATANGYYAGFDPEAPPAQREPRFADVQVLEIDLEPGEALFIPVGWWHQVRALSPSISFSLLGFAFPNAQEAAFAARG